MVVAAAREEVAAANLDRHEYPSRCGHPPSSRSRPSCRMDIAISTPDESLDVPRRRRPCLSSSFRLGSVGIGVTEGGMEQEADASCCLPVHCSLHLASFTWSRAWNLPQQLHQSRTRPQRHWTLSAIFRAQFDGAESADSILAAPSVDKSSPTASLHDPAQSLDIRAEDAHAGDAERHSHSGDQRMRAHSLAP